VRCLPHKVIVLIMILTGWFESCILLDLNQPIFLLSAHDCTSRYILQFLLLVLRNLLIPLHNTFLVLINQKKSPLMHCLHKSLYVTYFEILNFSLTSLPIVCADNAILDPNEWWYDKLHALLRVANISLVDMDKNGLS